MANEMRDRLVELLNNYPCMSTAEDMFIESISDDLADYLIENGVIVPQWISVKDRLPDNEERVLVTVDSDKSDTKIDTDRMVYRQWVRWGMSVTHWMPLPELPKSDDSQRSVGLEDYCSYGERRCEE